MSSIISILRAAHCRSTHHYFALDGLATMRTAQAIRLRDLLLKHHDEYLLGAKAPDNSFRDFQNHVLHVADNNWGGAVEACEKWMKTALDHLNNQHWKKAAYACGVLSHYFTDPIMPLHTCQSEHEAVVHRPMEWSVYKSYDAIYQTGVKQGLGINFQLASSNDWIGKAVVAAARIAHPHYHRLIEIYDLDRGIQTPADGLNAEARNIFSELIHVAVHGWGAVLTRLADETTAEIPKTSLSLTAILATIDMPLAWIVRRISDSAEQRAVSAIVKEFTTTGTLTKHVPQEISVVNRERAKSAASEMSSNKNTKSQSAASETAIPQMVSTHSISTETYSTTLGATAQSRVESDQPVPASTRAESQKIFQFEAFNGLILPELPTAGTAWVARDLAQHGAGDQQENIAEEPVTANHSRRVNYHSNLVDAPSIGPKTAKRFEHIGIKTIEQFVAAEASWLVAQLATRWITPELISDWQSQACLVCDVPELCGYKAQLLVAVHCRTVSDLATSSPTALNARIEQFCATQEGQRILRSSAVPPVSEISRWIDAARERQLRLAS